MSENNVEPMPVIHFVERYIAGEGLSNYITDMESAGQAQLVHSEMVPFVGHETLKPLGFTFGERPDSDSLFISCAMPCGWKKEGSDHAMWSYLLDERGIRRAAMFYKAAFYDRRAFVRLEYVGEALAGNVVHGEEPVAIPAVWDKLTDDERAEFIATLKRDRREYLDDDFCRRERPHYAERCTAMLALVDGESTDA